MPVPKSDSYSLGRLNRNKQDLESAQSLTTQFNNLVSNHKDIDFVQFDRYSNPSKKKFTYKYQHLEVSAKKNVNVANSITSILTELIKSKALV